MITIFPENLVCMFSSGLWAPSWDLILSRSELEVQTTVKINILKNYGDVYGGKMYCKWDLLTL